MRVSPHCASLESTHNHTHTYMHTHTQLHSHSFDKHESFAVVMETLVPRLSPTPPLISSSILYDSLQSVNLELSPNDAISGMVIGGGSK